MSRVTNVIMTYPLMPTKLVDGRGPLEWMNHLMHEAFNRQSFGCDLSEPDPGNSPVGGHKNLEQCVHVSAFNHVDVNEIRARFSEYPWEYPQVAQLMIQDQEEDGFSVETAASIRAGIPRKPVEL